MFTIVGLHYGVCTYRLPGSLNEIAAYQSMGTWGDAHCFVISPTLVYPWCQTYIARQMFYAIEPSQIAQLAEYATSYNAPDTGNTAQQHIVFLVVLLAIPSELGRNISKLFVDEPEKTHTAF